MVLWKWSLMENLEIIEYHLHILIHENKLLWRTYQFFCCLETLRFLNRHLAEILKTKWVQTYLLDNLGTPVWKHLQDIKNSFILALGKVCVCPEEFSSVTQHCLDVSPREEKTTKSSTLMPVRLPRECRFSINLSLCTALGYGSPEGTQLLVGNFTCGI